MCVTAFNFDPLFVLAIRVLLESCFTEFWDFPGTGVVISHLEANLDWVGDLRVSNVYNSGIEKGHRAVSLVLA